MTLLDWITQIPEGPLKLPSIGEKWNATVPECKSRPIDLHSSYVAALPSKTRGPFGSSIEVIELELGEWHAIKRANGIRPTARMGACNGVEA